MTVLSQCLDACMVWQLFEENVDTVGELLMSALLLPLPASPVALMCWKAVNALWADFGFLPGPGLDPKEFGTLAGTERDAYAFQNNYHTMYVAGLLNAVVLQRGLRAAAPVSPREPAGKVSAGTTVPGRKGPTGSALPHGRTGVCPPHWRRKPR